MATNDDADNTGSEDDDNNDCRLHECTQLSFMRIGVWMQASASSGRLCCRPVASVKLLLGQQGRTL